jgi:N-methylhydantoinase A
MPDAATMAKLIADFHDAYEREYTYRLDAGVEIIGLHLVAASEVGKLEIVALPRTGATLEAAIKGRRAVDYATEGVHEATIYDGTRLEPGMTVIGPAVIEDPRHHRRRSPRQPRLDRRFRQYPHRHRGAET